MYSDENEKDQFDIWWENPETQRRFHCGGFNDRDIAIAAWEESKRQYNDDPSFLGDMIDEHQRKTLHSWLKNHGCTITYEGAIGGKTTYHISPTSLGPVIKVSCDCGSSMDLTDYENW